MRPHPRRLVALEPLEQSIEALYSVAPRDGRHVVDDVATDQDLRPVDHDHRRVVHRQRVFCQRERNVGPS